MIASLLRKITLFFVQDLTILIKHILYVDDDRDDADIFCEALQLIDRKINCTIAGSGQEALDLFTMPCFDIVFLDFHMPLLNGLDTLKGLGGMPCYPMSRVILYSTFMSQLQKNECYDFGASMCLTKPSNFDDIVLILRRLLAA